MEATGETFVAPRMVANFSIKELAEKIVRFSEILCGIELYRYQRRFALAIIESILRRDGLELTALLSRQSGKTETVALAAIGCAVLLPAMHREFPDDERFFSYKSGFKCGIYGPKEKQAKIAFDRIRKYADSDNSANIYRELGIDVEISRKDTVAWSNGSYIVCETASENVDNEGQGWDLVICDESQKYSYRKIEKQISPMLASTNGPLVMIGTASDALGYFFRRVEQNLETERVTGKRTHFQYDYEQIIKERRRKYDMEADRYRRFSAASPEKQIKLLNSNPLASKRPNPTHLNYEKYIEKKIASLRGNLDDESFMMNFRLLWQSNRSIAVAKDHWESLAIPNLELNAPVAEGHLVAGLDIAKGTSERSDSTVLSIFHVDTFHPELDQYMTDKVSGKEVKTDTLLHYNKTLVGLYIIQGSFEHKQYGKIVEICRMYPSLVYMMCDSTSIGDPVTERLEVLLHWINVQGITFSTANKSMLYKKFLEEVKSSRIRYPGGPSTKYMKEFEELNSQVTGLQRYNTDSGFLVCCAADESCHDDVPDSMALANYAVERSLEDLQEKFEKINSSPFRESDRSTGFSGQGNAGRQSRYRAGRMGRSRRR